MASTQRILTVSEAREIGVSWRGLQGRRWRRVGPGQYSTQELVNQEVRLTGASLRLPAGAAFAGKTAAWLHGLDLPPCDPIEVVAPVECGLSTRAGLRVRRARLERVEIVSRRGLPATSMTRTLSDLAWQLPLPDAVAAADAALHRRLISLPDLEAAATFRAGRQGVGKLRRLLTLVDPRAESPMETRLRLLLLQSGLPRPESQVTLVDASGAFIGRADFFYPDARLVVEYDGSQHRDALVEDNRRQNLLIDAGYRILRFTASDLKDPRLLVEQVRRGLRGIDLYTDRPLNGS